MVRVGVQAALPERLLEYIPKDVELVRIPAEVTEPLDVDFWVLPFSKKEAQAIVPHLRGLKAAQTITAGVDSIVGWMPEGVTLCDGRGIHDVSTSEWVVTAILATYKRFPFYRDLQNKQEWKGQSQDSVFTDDDSNSNGLYRILGEDVHGKKILIVGYGSIGSAIEARLTPFGAEFIRIARTPKQNPEVHAISELHALLPKADVVVLIVPLTEQTHGFFGAKEMALMQRGALLVNGARGPIVVTDALVDALNAGHIRAAVDVTDPEPLPAGHPLWTAPNLLLTPHVAGSTPEFITRAFKFVGEQVKRFAKGEPLENIVTDAGY
jgi:phosphoglycerate dehydrogenase-like enzyme